MLNIVVLLNNLNIKFKSKKILDKLVGTKQEEQDNNRRPSIIKPPDMGPNLEPIMSVELIAIE